VKATRTSLPRSAVCLAVLSAFLLMPGAGRAGPATFYVGVGARDISPTPAEIATDSFFLGGYDFGSGRVGTQDTYFESGIADARTAVGVMGDSLGSNPFAPWIRAIAIGDSTNTIVLADFDNQGTFASYKPNYSTGALRPYALDDIRAAAAAAAPGLAARSIMISSDHSHAGQDLTGVWGFVPDEYLARVKDLAVLAIVEAYNNMKADIVAERPATLKQSAIETPQPCGPDADSPTRVFNNQFCGGSVVGAVDPNRDHANDPVDAQVRVLRAFHRDETAPFAMLVNAAIHATVGGGDNRYVSSDWVSTLSNYLERDNPGARAVTIVGDVGRTQPNDRSCQADDPNQPGLQFLEPLSGKWVPYDVDERTGDSCPISQFARRVQAWVNKAVDETEQPVATAGVDYREMFIRDPSDSVLLFGLDYAGDPAGVPIVRGITSPYLSGSVLGTWVGAYRVGDLLMVSAPGEAYPAIRDGVVDVVNTTKPVWIFGLANDQLGYLIAPTPDGYPEPIRQSFLNGNARDPSTWGFEPINNDNFFFNVSQTLGDHVMCAMIKGAFELGFGSTLDPVTATPKCATWAGEVNESGPGDPTWNPH
jgi:hypothetical protein